MDKSSILRRRAHPLLTHEVATYTSLARCGQAVRTYRSNRVECAIELLFTVDNSTRCTQCTWTRTTQGLETEATDSAKHRTRGMNLSTQRACEFRPGTRVKAGALGQFSSSPAVWPGTSVQSAKGLASTFKCASASSLPGSRSPPLGREGVCLRDSAVLRSYMQPNAASRNGASQRNIGRGCYS